MNAKLTCIVCPAGCRLEVAQTAAGEFLVTGHTCQRGKEYAVLEMTNPVRILTTTVKLNNGLFKRLPVKTDRAIPKGKLFAVMEKIKQQEVSAPVKMGEIIMENVLDTGCNIIATKST